MYCLMRILSWGSHIFHGLISGGQVIGGLLIMMGHHARSEALFYYFRLEYQVLETHLLRLIDKHISFDFVREQLEDSYSETRGPSIDPELLLHILLIGYFSSQLGTR